MASGLAALLDDVATIAKLAAASVDDVGAAAGRAAAKAAGVVIDDTAVTPQYVTGFTPDRELPIIGRIAKGSLKNKLIFILPVALLLSAFLPVAITPLLMIGGTYLCFEGAEKIIEKFGGESHSLAEEAAELATADHEKVMVAGAIRTDFILSAEIMAIALAQVAGQSIIEQALILIIVAIGITIGVYGVVALIVKMDDIGLHLAREGGSSVRRALGLGLVRTMPVLLGALGTIGTLAMLWVGGQIVLHGLDEFGFSALPQFVHHAAESAAAALPTIGGLAEFTVNAALSGVFGLVLGGIVVAGHNAWVKLRGGKH